MDLLMATPPSSLRISSSARRQLTITTGSESLSRLYSSFTTVASAGAEHSCEDTGQAARQQTGAHVSALRPFNLRVWDNIIGIFYLAHCLSVNIGSTYFRGALQVVQFGPSQHGHSSHTRRSVLQPLHQRLLHILHQTGQPEDRQ